MGFCAFLNTTAANQEHCSTAIPTAISPCFISVSNAGCSGSQFRNFPMSLAVRKCLEEVKRRSPNFSINTLALRLAAQETKARFGVHWSHAPMRFTGIHWHHIHCTLWCVCSCWAAGGVSRVQRTTHDT